MMKRPALERLEDDNFDEDGAAPTAVQVEEPAAPVKEETHVLHGFRDTVATVMNLSEESEVLKEAQFKETEALLIGGDSSGIKEMGVFAAVKRFGGAYEGTSFGLRSMFRTAWWYVKQDTVLCVLTSLFLVAASVFSFWAPNWISVALRLTFTDVAGAIPLGEFCLWLFIFVLVVALLWAATGSLLFLMNRHFSQRMKWHVAVVGTEDNEACRSVVQTMNLDEIVHKDLPLAGRFLFHQLPLAMVSLLSIVMGFGMIFYESWVVGLTALFLFVALALVSAVFDSAALAKYKSSSEKGAREADLWRVLHNEDCTEDERNRAASAIMDIATEKEAQSVGLSHVFMGVFYRLTTLVSPVVFFLVTGKSVISNYLKGFELVICAVYYAYVVLAASFLSSSITNSHHGVGSALRVMLFVNGTNKSVNQHVPFELRKLNRHRVHQPWGMLALLAVGLAATVGTTAFLFSANSVSSCAPVPYRCTIEATEIGWTDALSGILDQDFQVNSGCAFTSPPSDILSKCARELIPNAPSNMALQTAEVKMSFSDWKGMNHGFFTDVTFDTDAPIGGRRLLQTVDDGGGVGSDQGGCVGDDSCSGNGAFACVNGEPVCTCDCGFGGSSCELPNGDTGCADTNSTGPGDGTGNEVDNNLTPSPTPAPTSAAPTSPAPTTDPPTTPAPTEPPTEPPTFNNGKGSLDDWLDKLNGGNTNGITTAIQNMIQSTTEMLRAGWNNQKNTRKRIERRVRRRRSEWDMGKLKQESRDRADRAYADRVAQCEDLYSSKCDGKRNCIRQMVLNQERRCAQRSFGHTASCSDCAPGWECVSVQPDTCFSCATAVCRKPEPQNLLTAAASITVGKPISGSARAIANGVDYTDNQFDVLGDGLVYLCGAAWDPLEVDLGEEQTITGVGINGWNGGYTFRPQGSWVVEGTNDPKTADSRTWTHVVTGSNELWNSGDDNLGYPFRPDDVVQVTGAAPFRYYRIVPECNNNGFRVMIENLALFGTPGVAN